MKFDSTSPPWERTIFFGFVLINTIIIILCEICAAHTTNKHKQEKRLAFHNEKETHNQKLRLWVSITQNTSRFISNISRTHLMKYSILEC